MTLARDAHRVVGAEGFLALQLLLLRDNERWHDLLAAAEAADPHDHGRFEIMLQKARALEKTGRSTEALRAYNDLAIIDFDLPWLVAARQRLATQTKADMTEAIQPPPGLDSAGDGPTFASRGAFVYDPLRPLVGAPTREGPTPGVPPAADRSSSALRSKLALVSASLSLGGYLDGRVTVYPFPGPNDSLPPATWLDLLKEQTVGVVAQRLNAAIASEPPAKGFRKRPDPAVIAARPWQRVLAALLSAAANDADSAERLVQILESSECRAFVDNLDSWLDATITSVIGELSLTPVRGRDSVVLALIAQLHARGKAHAAGEWITWAGQDAPSPGLRCAAVAVAFELGDDQSVLRLTDGLTPANEHWIVVLRTYRARALQRLGRTPAAIQLLGETIRSAAGVDDDGHLLVCTRYLRARAAILSGRTGLALDDLHAIQAIESDFLDVSDLLASVAAGQAGRREHIPRDVRYEVFQRDGGHCTQCGAAFDIQYDHIIPLAMGGSSNAENLQLLCGGCNRRKSATLG